MTSLELKLQHIENEFEASLKKMDIENDRKQVNAAKAPKTS
jgi:hypothetical protein